MKQGLTDEQNPQDWFEFAADRLRAAHLLWTHEGLTTSGIELLQEAVERYIKGYLIAVGWRLERTHDLEVLFQDAIARQSRFAQFELFARALTEDFFAQHYPGEDLTGVGVDHEQQLLQADELAALLPQYFTSTSGQK
jgi:HEPN domain-containing protein